MKPLLGSVACVVLLAAGCGSTGSEDPPRGGTLSSAERALVAAATDRAGKPDSANTEPNLGRVFTGRAVGVELRFDADGEYDGDLLTIAVGTGIVPADRDCAGFADRVAGCVEVDGGVLAWEKVEPEEDPGVVHLVLPKGETTVLVSYAGPDITGDPRRLDLPISVDDLRAIAADARVDLRY